MEDFRTKDRLDTGPLFMEATFADLGFVQNENPTALSESTRIAGYIHERGPQSPEIPGFH
jgi:hypothetical protein